MAVGASEGDVIRLVLIECLFIGLIGGILGDIAGIGLCGIINTVGKQFVIAQLGDAFVGFAGAELTHLSPAILLLGIVIAVVLSLLAGIYPAVKAAKLNPADAIRHR